MNRKSIKKYFIKKREAFSLVEIMLAMTIFTIITTGIVIASLEASRRDIKVETQNEALWYAQEGLEAVRSIRDRNYLLVTNGDHGLDLVDGAWVFVEAPEIIDDFYERTVTVEDVYRDVNGDIATEGTFDPETKRVISEVRWTLNGLFDQSVTLTTYLSNWTGDDWVETTCTDFDLGTYEGTTTVEMSGPPSDNCGLQIETTEEGSSFFASSDIGEHGNDVFIEGSYAYVATNKTQEGLSIVNISDPNNPSVVSQIDIGGKGNYIHKDGNYVYIGVDDQDNGLVIVNVSNVSNPSIASQIDIGGQGNQPETYGSILYIGVQQGDSDLAVIDISDPNNPSIANEIDFGEDVRVTITNGNYAYIGLTDDDAGFRILDISDPTNPSELSNLNLNEEVNAISLSGTFAFVGTEESDNSFHVINIADPNNPVDLSSIDVGGEIQDLSLNGDYAYAAIDQNQAGLAAINISSPTNPSLSYTLDVQGKGTGIDSDTNYLYVTLNVNNRGLVITGVTEQGIETTGNYISAIFDTGSNDTRFNFIEWDHIEVPGSSIQIQIRTASSESGIESATWVGSDGTNSTFYESPRTEISLASNSTGSRYIQIYITINSDGANSNILESIRINYIP